VDEVRLETSVRSINGIPVIDVAGEIDLYTAPAFRDILRQAFDDGHRRILVNMSQVRYVDSSGFGTLLGATKRLRPSGGSISLVGCNPSIQKMLRVTRLNTLFGVFDAEDDAVAALRNPM
jgi:anti-sigma B factor antagonist